MKLTFKKASFILSITLLTGILIFSACKKDEKDPAGTKAAKELCDCASKTNETESGLCILGWLGKYMNQFDFDFNMDDETLDVNEVKFKDKTFQRDFESQIVRCEAIRE